jgi:hypothetical protein
LGSVYPGHDRNPTPLTSHAIATKTNDCPMTLLNSRKSQIDGIRTLR